MDQPIQPVNLDELEAPLDWEIEEEEEYSLCEVYLDYSDLVQHGFVHPTG